MITTGNRFLSLSKAILVLSIFLISLNAQSQENNKQWKVRLSFNPHLSRVSPSSILETKPKLNYGAGVHLMRENTSKNSFFSYGISLDRNSNKKLNLPDNTEVVDYEGNIIEDNIRQFNATIFYPYLGLSVAYNYKILNRENSCFGISTAVTFKYFLKYNTQYNLHDGSKYSQIKGKNLKENNYVLNNPSVNLSFWYRYNFAENWDIMLGAHYSYDLNFTLIPKYHNLGVSFGVVKNINFLKNRSK